MRLAKSEGAGLNPDGQGNYPVWHSSWNQDDWWDSHYDDDAGTVWYGADGAAQEWSDQNWPDAAWPTQDAEFEEVPENHYGAYETTVDEAEEWYNCEPYASECWYQEQDGSYPFDEEYADEILWFRKRQRQRKAAQRQR